MWNGISAHWQRLERRRQEKENEAQHEQPAGGSPPLTPVFPPRLSLSPALSRPAPLLRRALLSPLHWNDLGRIDFPDKRAGNTRIETESDGRPLSVPLRENPMPLRRYWNLLSVAASPCYRCTWNVSETLIRYWGIFLALYPASLCSKFPLVFDIGCWNVVNLVCFESIFWKVINTLSISALKYLNI